jgi:adenylylsulfate reductase subunit A
LEIIKLKTDVLVIGGGAAGCFHAITLANQSNCQIIVAEKAYIKRSGCLAAGVNALNAYIGEGETPESFVEYVKADAEEIIREDLVYDIAKELNHVTEEIEKLGLTLLKDEQGNYVGRGKRSIKINGENIKPLLAKATREKSTITVLEQIQITDYLIKKGEVIGAIGLSLKENRIYRIYAKAVVCATGGAAGIYKPNHPTFSRHKMWYSPFNTGAGYAMGIRAGAEMTSFEMRFIALRCSPTIAPTGTIAQGVGAKQINQKGEYYLKRYGKPTTDTRLYATIQENLEGRGPCYLETKGMDEQTQNELFKAYLNMAPAQTLHWLERETGPKDENVKIDGSEPYIVGGHTASGYWIDSKRRTTLKGLYAIGDVAGGSPKKYVTGCFAEGKIAAQTVKEEIATKEWIEDEEISQSLLQSLEAHLTPATKKPQWTLEELEAAMQEVMDQYAGGRARGYVYNSKDLVIATSKLEELGRVLAHYQVSTTRELGQLLEILDRIEVAKVLIAHLEARKETRWLAYQQNADYPSKDDVHYKKYINSVCKEGKINILFRELVGREAYYEHSHS